MNRLGERPYSGREPAFQRELEIGFATRSAHTHRSRLDRHEGRRRDRPCVIRDHEELIRGRWDTAFEDDGANNKALWQCSGLLIELCLDVLDLNVRHAIAAIVLRVPFGRIEPANQINADLRVQRDHVISEQLSFESREQFTVPATLGLDDGGEGIEQPAI